MTSSAIVKLVRAATDRAVERVGDREIAALIAAERAAADALSETTDTRASMTRLLRKADLCKALQLCPRTIEQMVRSKRIAPSAVIRVGRSIRFDLARVLESLRGQMAPESKAQAWARRVSGVRAVEVVS